MIIRKFLDPDAPSLPQQVAENTDKLEKMSKIYKTTQNLTSSTTTININTTNIVDLDNCIIDTFLFSRNGLLFKIKSYTNETLYIEFYSDLSSTNEVITNFEFNPDVVVYENGNARIVGTIKYNQDSLLEPVEAPAEINIPIIAGEGMVVDANEENDKIEIHIDNDAISNPNLLINGDFRVNQRGLTNYTENLKYTVDRWEMTYGNSLVVNADHSVTHISNASGQGIRQFIENPSFLNGKTITYSVEAQGDTYGFYISIQKGSTIIAQKTYNSTDRNRLILTTTIPNDTFVDSDRCFVTIYNFQGAENITIYNAKLEIGSVATAYSPRPYGEELALSQRYFVSFEGLSYTTIIFGYARSEKNYRTIWAAPVTLRTQPTYKIKNGSLEVYINNIRYTPDSYQILTIANNLINLECIFNENTIQTGVVGSSLIENTIVEFDSEIY